MTRQGGKTEQKAADEFHMMVGYCIADWARIEDELFRIFQACLRASAEQCAIIYYRMPGLDIRLGLVDEIVKSILPKKPKRSGSHEHQDVKRWNRVFTDCKNLLSVRRRIAHHPVRAQYKMKPVWGPIPWFLSQDAGAPQMAQASFEIYVSQNEQSRGKDDGPSPLTITDLQQHLKATAKLYSELNAYFCTVLGPSLGHIQQAPLRSLETN
jgi:hypothetical protein